MMKVWHIAALAALGLVSAGAIAFFSAVVPLPKDFLDAGEEIVQDESLLPPITESNELIVEMLSENKLPGLSISVAVGGDVVWSRAIGYADLPSKRPLTTKTSMRIGSVSKSVTSLALGKLIEQGKLDLDATIEQLAIDFPTKSYPITPRQLATHTAGIRHYTSGIGPLPSAEMLSNEHYDSVSDSLSIFADSSLLFEPGSGFSYSTYGYTLLSAVIEKASGAPYVETMASEVFEPLQMNHTTPEFQDLAATEVATYYLSLFGNLIDTPETDHSNKWAGGGLLSTPTDLVTMGNALLYGNYLRSETLELLFTPQALENGEINEQNYGIGWRIDDINFVNDDDSVTTFQAIHHGGRSNGAGAFMILFPAEGVVVAITSNGLSPSGSELGTLAFRIGKRFIDFIDS
jgi:CubicO group peptidase (beta-lactamase class C family)